ncbi:MAG: class I SAM-dependent methyltransferase [Candidatus Lernaella stagnicola]|nr:class I SAM-dependent methyltransferase [Candidatus Lernaella stagnicola]
MIRRFRNPHKILQSMGVKARDRVLEIGCGPGFFTIPTAQIVGPQGEIAAIDVNPFAINYTQRKVDRHGITNARVLHANAADTDLPAHSFDFAFFIGVPHITGGLGPVADELRRVLKPGGRIAFHYGRRSPESLVAQMREQHFALVETRGRVGVFAPIAAPVSA